MTRIYDNRALARTSNISFVVLAVVIVFGCWDLWNAFAGGSNDPTSSMFGVLFVGGGLFGGYTIWNENRDQAQWLDVDLDAGKGTLAVWRPFRPQVIDMGLDRITAWRHWVKVGKRNMRTHYLLASFPGYPRPVYFELLPGKDVPDAFRRLAPEAIDDFETNTGRARPGAETPAT